MALNRFLFSSAENVYTIKKGIGTVSATGTSIKDFGSTQIDSAKNKAASMPGTPSLANVGTGSLIGPQMILGGLATGVGAAVGGFGSVLDFIAKKATAALFQEMYVNPDSFSMGYVITNTLKETRGGVIINHWRPQLPQVSMSGVVGWIRDESLLNSAVNNFAKALVGGQNAGKAFTSTISNNFAGVGSPFSSLGALQRFREKSRNLSNSPRKFLDNLQTLALSPMYYFDDKGIQRYNTKKLVVFTKRYPDGAILSGFFNEFSFDEKGNDAETIRYSLKFVVTGIERVDLSVRLGQFIAPFYGALKDTTSAISGVGSGIGQAVTNPLGSIGF